MRSWPASNRRCRLFRPPLLVPLPLEVVVDEDEEVEAHREDDDDKVRRRGGGSVLVVVKVEVAVVPAVWSIGRWLSQPFADAAVVVLMAAAPDVRRTRRTRPHEHEMMERAVGRYQSAVKQTKDPATAMYEDAAAIAVVQQPQAACIHTPRRFAHGRCAFVASGAAARRGRFFRYLCSARPGDREPKQARCCSKSF